MKAINGFPGYFINESGEVFSSRRTHGGGGIGGELHKLRINYDFNDRGYVSMYDGLGSRKTKMVHRLVLETFVGPCPPGNISRHGIGGGRDHSLSNLCWGTRSQNNGEDRWRDRTISIGEYSGKSKLTEDDVRAIRKRAGRLSRKQLAAQYGVAVQTIACILRRQTWGWLE